MGFLKAPRTAITILAVLALTFTSASTSWGIGGSTKQISTNEPSSAWLCAPGDTFLEAFFTISGIDESLGTAPASITVPRVLGAEVAELFSSSAGVATYVIVDTTGQNLISGHATADIYDGFSGIFKLDHISCDYGGGGTGVPCPDVLVVAAIGSGQKYRSDTDLSVSPQLSKVYSGIVRTKGSKSVDIKVLDYPALGVETLYAGLNSITTTNKLDYVKKAKRLFDRNASTYLNGKDEGVAQMFGALASVEFGCATQGTKLVLIGYSQGAMVVHEFLNQLAGTSLAGYVVGAVMVADPERVKNSQVSEFADANRASFGVCSMISAFRSCTTPFPHSDISRQFLGRTLSVCADRDPVCETSDVADALAYNFASRKLIFASLPKIHSNYTFRKSTENAGMWLGRKISAS